MSSTEFDISFDLPKNQSNVIKVIGVGGGGTNAINHMFKQGINGVDFVVCNTDSQSLENSPVPIKIQLGVNLTEGLGAGANPTIGEQAALESFDELKEMMDTNTKMVFITAGMGGGTGTGAAPIIAKQAKDMGILTVGIVTSPFQFEGRIRNAQAQKGVEKLRENVDSLIVINNNKLREVYGNLGFKAGFSKADEVLATASRGIAEVITHHYTQNIDLRDAKTVLSNSGTAIMGSAVSSGSNRSQDAIMKALDSPLLNDNKITGAQNVLLLIVSGSNEITLDEIGEINDHIQEEAGNSANIIMGVGEDEALEESISVTVIATGFNKEQQNVIVNTEEKKIIHTLEDEQKAVQDLTPKDQQKGFSAAGPTSEPKQEEKIVHNLEEEPENHSSANNQADLEPVSNSDLLRNMDVNYEEVVYNEEDFVIIDSSKKINDLEVEEPEEVKEEKPTEAQDQDLFTFNFPINKEEKPIEEKENDKTNQEKVVYNLEEEKQKERQEQSNNTRANSNSTRENTSNEKRYSLEDYMELEDKMQNAKPPQNETRTNQPSSTSQPESSFKTYTRQEQEKAEAQETQIKTDEEEGAEVDPFNSPISENLIARAAERRKRMKNFNYKFRNNNNIDEIEKQPAYKRAGVDLDQKQGSDEKMSRTSVSNNNEDNEISLRSNNSFLHDNVD